MSDTNGVYCCTLHERDALRAERDALRDAIRNAPHGLGCAESKIVTVRDCNCWRAAALAGTPEDRT